MVSVWAGWGDREEGLVGTGWNRLEPAVVGPASPPSSLSLRTESPWGSAGPSSSQQAGPGTGTWERSPVGAGGLSRRLCG